MKKHILFVNDDSNYVAKLRSIVDKVQWKWDIHFTRSGREALNILKKEPYDVLICDVNLPDMNYTDLLKQVREQYPKIARIVLTSLQEKENTLRAIRLAHQCLLKSSVPDDLESKLNSIFNLHDLFINSNFRRIISQIDFLPSISFLYDETLRRLNLPNTSTRAIGELIAKDMGMTSTILRLVNSAFFGFAYRISDPVHAVNLLGLETVKTLVFSIKLFSQFQKENIEDLSIEDFWRHSLEVGILARRISTAERMKKQVIHDSFTAGLLHDVGKFIVAANLPDEYHAAISLAVKKKIEVSKAEQEVIGTTHAEIGAYLLGLWGLPEKVVEAVAFHHRPRERTPIYFTPLSAVYIANILRGEINSSGNTVGKRPELDMGYLLDLGLTKHLSMWQKICHSTHNDYKAIFKESCVFPT